LPCANKRKQQPETKLEAARNEDMQGADRVEKKKKEEYFLFHFDTLRRKFCLRYIKKSFINYRSSLKIHCSTPALIALRAQKMRML